MCMVVELIKWQWRYELIKWQWSVLYVYGSGVYCMCMVVECTVCVW